MLRPNYGLLRFKRVIRQAERVAGNPAKEHAILFRSLKSGMWFEAMRLSLGAETAADVGRALFPERYAKKTFYELPRKDKRIERYALGVNEISAAHRKAGDRLASQAMVHCPPTLFEALDVSRPLADRANDLLLMMSPKVRRAVFKAPQGSGVLVRRTADAAARNLLALAFTEGVVAGVILLREASEQGQRELTMLLGENLYYMTLVWCSRWPVYASHREIALYLVSYIFPLAFSDTIALKTDLKSYIDAIECLRFHVFNMNRLPVKVRMNVLDEPFPGWELLWDVEYYGLVYRWGLAPGLKLLQPSLADRKSSQEVSARLVGKTWGWRVLRLLEKDYFPPHRVYALLFKELSSLTQNDLDSLETTKELKEYSWMRSPLNIRT